MISIIPFTNHYSAQWDLYVRQHQYSSLYHLSFFRSVIENTYHHKSYYFLALNDKSEVKGVCPLFFINSLFSGRELVSLPFCDYGGILSDTAEIYGLLLKKAIETAKTLKCKNIELRQTSQINPLPQNVSEHISAFTVHTSKCRMVLSLPPTTDQLLSSFPAKLRSQIRKPQKDGCSCKIGGLELLDDFYDVFTFNMRDLGSPVHSKALIKNMLSNYPEHTRLFVVYLNSTPVACSLAAGFNNSLINPWASFKRTFQKSSPNMMLYWEMLSFGINNGYQYFDFGRSTAGEGTFKFKAQWGAQPAQLFWYNYGSSKLNQQIESSQKKMFINLWQKMPLQLTTIIGPVLRRQIHL